jgi:hypothetical protein
MKSTSTTASVPGTTADTVRQAANVVALLVTLAVNYLANSLPINGQTTAAVSDQFPVYFVPAGYVFSIWGIIYLGLIAYAFYQALPSQRTNPTLRRINYLFVAACIANCTWLVLWHYEQFALTAVAMLSLLLLLIAIYRRLAEDPAQVTTAERWLVRMPFSIYLGWITVATIANVTDVLYLTGWDGWPLSAEMWAVVMLIAASLITSVIALTRLDLAYTLIIVWAFAGIAVKQWDTSSLVAVSGSVLAALVLLVGLLAVAIPRTRKPQLQSGTA